MSESRRISWIWKHISEVKKNKYKCNLCDKNLERLYDRIKYHLYHSHKLLNAKEMEVWKSDTNDLIWQYFSKQDGYIACCKNCNKLIKHAYQKQALFRHLYFTHKHIIQAKREIMKQTWLSRHFIFLDWRAVCIQHNCIYSANIFQEIDILEFHLCECHNINQYSECEERSEDSKAEGMIQQSVDETNCAGPSSRHDNTHSHRASWIWRYISGGKGKHQCNLCDKNFGINRNEIKYHLYHNHKLFNAKEMEEWKNDTNDLIWQYFSKQDGYIACCKNCNILIKRAYKKSVLFRHLYFTHKHIIQAKRQIIDQTWLSQHFIFKDWRALCQQKGCSYSAGIIQKIDVLEFHLHVRHDINKYSECDERSEDSKAEGMIQQSIDETNCAGPSSHHGTHRQSLGNQENLQE